MNTETDRTSLSSCSLPWYQRPKLRSFLMGTGALLLYGGWAFAANYPHGISNAAKAAATQGIISLTITVAVTSAMEFSVRRVSSRVAQIFIPFTTAQVLATGYTVTLHWIIGTPELLWTVIPVLSLGAVYNMLYSLNLAREIRARIQPDAC